MHSYYQSPEILTVIESHQPLEILTVIEWLYDYGNRIQTLPSISPMFFETVCVSFEEMLLASAKDNKTIFATTSKQVGTGTPSPCSSLQPPSYSRFPDPLGKFSWRQRIVFFELPIGPGHDSAVRNLFPWQEHTYNNQLRAFPLSPYRNLPYHRRRRNQ